MDEPRYYSTADAWDGSILRVCGWCSFPQPDDTSAPEFHAPWCDEEAKADR